MSDIYVGVTDNAWFRFLRERKPDEVNFWKPSGQGFQALRPGGLFVFKLHAPHRKLAGFGIFLRYSVVPLKFAWEAFGEKNGVASLEDFQKRIARKTGRPHSNPMIGCIVLAQPVFFDDHDWMDQPASWADSIVSGRGYEMETAEGKYVYSFAQERLQLGGLEDSTAQDSRYKYRMQKIRYGQGGFSVLVSESYQRRCAISGERTFPALEAAHIRPYSKDGPHLIENGLLLRSDIHKVFDDGYMTITDDYIVEVSKRLREDFENGRDYYRYDGQRLQIVPTAPDEKPSSEFLRWHQNNVYLG